MTATGDLRIDDWVVHRPNVVRSVAARVPGVDAEEAASRALEKMVRIVSGGGTIDDPAPYWRRAAVNEAISMTRAAGRTPAVEDTTLAGLFPPVDGAELDAERQADVSMLRSALSSLADSDRTILVDRHVNDRAVNDIAGDLGVRPHAVTMRLRRAEERLAGAFAATHAQDVNDPECRSTRAGMHDYLKGRLLPRRQQRLEAHMDGCAECTRAFIDVREVSWMLRDLGQHVVAAAVVTGAVTGVAGVSGGAAGLAGVARLRSFGTKQAAVAAGVVAVLVVGGGAFALIAGQPDVAPVQTTVAAPGESAAPAEPKPPPAPPAASRTRPAGTTDVPEALPQDPAPEQDAAPAPEAEPVRAPRPPDPAPVQAQVQAPVRAPEPRPAPARTADEPDAAEEPAAPAPEPEPEPVTEPEPEPELPVDAPDGPPGNPGNTNGKGPVKDNDQGPGNKNGAKNGNGPGSNNGKGNAKGNGMGNGLGNGMGQAKGHGAEAGPDQPTSTTVLE